MNESKTTHQEMINWIDDEIVNIALMRDKDGDPYFDKQAAMLAAIRKRLVDAEECREAGYET